MRAIESGVPRWKSLSVFDLFRHGPWEVILPLWVVGAIITAAWLSNPFFRIIPIADWKICAVIGGLIAGLLSAFAVRRIYADAGTLVARMSMVGGMLLGAIALAWAAQGPLHPTTAQASTCAPWVNIRESSLGHYVAFILPVLLYVLWCKFLIMGFPALQSFAQLFPHSLEGRLHAYSDSLKKLPFRIGGSIVFLLFLSIWAWRAISLGSSVNEIIEALRRVPPEALVGKGIAKMALWQRVAEARQQAERDAFSSLSNLKLDEARPLVSRAACDWVLPGQRPSAALLDIERAFRALDGEISGTASETWKPSEVATEAIIQLLPINGGSSGLPVCPLFWPSTAATSLPQYVSNGDIRRSVSLVKYRSRDLVDIRLAVLPLSERSGITIEVAMRVVGRTGGSSSLIKELVEHIGGKPSDGPRSIGNGAVCASWNLGRVGIRLGPAVGPSIPDRDMSPDSALWITCFDRSVSPTLYEIYRKPDGASSWDPHGCGVLASNDGL